MVEIMEDIKAADGSTPLDPDELAGLKQKHIQTMGELNEWEAENIASGLDWLSRKTRTLNDILNDEFCRELHKQMFSNTWLWAGTFRCSNKNIGVDKTEVSRCLRDLLENVKCWVEYGHYSVDETALRFHRDLVWIHPFPNGNGRFSRVMADLLVEALGGTRFSWGSDNLTVDSDVRKRYLEALREADVGNYALLLVFCRS